MAARKPLVLVDGETQQLQAADWIDLSDDINLTVTSPITLTDDDIGLDETAVDHNNLLNFVATKHFDTTSLSTGSVVISDGTTFVEDNVGLFFNTASNRLGIGSSSPQKNLHIESSTPTIRISDSNASTDQEVTGLIEFYRGNTTNRVGYVAMTSHANNILALATDYADGEIRLRTGNAVDRLIIDKDGNVSILENVVINGQLGLNITPTAWITLPAGTATAGTAPLKLTTGTSLTSPEVGAIEFTTDSIYFTITTGAARKEIALSEGLTSGRVTYATTNGRLIDDANLTYNGATLSSIDFNMPATTSSSAGIFMQALSPLMHTYSASGDDGGNFFLGGSAGNFTMSRAGGATNLASANTGIGGFTLNSLTTGFRNIGIGASGGIGITSGAYNVCIGHNSGLIIQSGTGNIHLGGFSGTSNTNSGNVFIGYYSGYSETAANTLVIDNAFRGNEAISRTTYLIYGIFAATAIAQDLVINAQLGLNITPTAWVTLPAGTATAGTAPLKFTSGTLTTAAVDGQIEYLSNVFYIRGSDNLDVAGTGKFSIVLTPEIKTDTSAPTDLTITTGVARTLILATPVFEDIQFPVTSAKVPASNAPTWETFTTNTNEYAFGVNDYMDLQANELSHKWKEGTDGHLHIHYTIKTAQSTGSDRFAKFSIWVAYSDTNEVWVEQAVLSFETTISTGSSALQAFYLDMGDALLTNYLRGGHIKMRVKRIAATGGTEYADDVYITQVGMHVEIDKIGSITEED